MMQNLTSVANRNVDKAREALRRLLSAEIALHPCSDGEERYLTAEVTGNYGGLYRLAVAKNNGGGGQGI